MAGLFLHNKAKPWNPEFVKLSIIIYIMTALITFGISIKNGNFPFIFAIVVLIYPVWGLSLLFLPSGLYSIMPGIVLSIALIIVIIGLKTKNTGVFSVLAILLLSALPVFIGIVCTRPFF
jgi:hypothetical protein